ncbi:MarR family winged helix-turn-helix transcriptional regulator [Roseovarius sp. D22-M7]|uniref:MarR family winged helix-turn-helix transcriptional regulator n=1 Tax=Roseovarius sp. D22-M7 TaxID=3127116 RepID=UPI00300FC206
MADPAGHAVAVTLFSEILTNKQLIRNRHARVLTRGMEISHFPVLNHLARVAGERRTAQLAKSFHVTRGAITNTLRRLEAAGYVHIRPDWDDTRRNMIAISPAGRTARDAAMAAITPMIADPIRDRGEDRVRASLSVLRELRLRLEG